jgi:ABC-type histidine transport system ATPase subunit
MSNPDLLLMDEPSEGLAPLIVREIARILLELKAKSRRFSWSSRTCDWHISGGWNLCHEQGE